MNFNTLVAVALLTIKMFVSVCHCNHLGLSDDRTADPDIDRQCVHFKNPEFASACRSIARDKNLRINKRAKADVWATSLKEKLRLILNNWRQQSRNGGLSRQMSSSTVQLSDGSTLTCPYMPCPVGNVERKSNYRSTSPWQYCENYDPYRFPQVMSVANKLCSMCINPEQQSLTINAAVKYITATVSVIRIRKNLYYPIEDFSECTSYTCSVDSMDIRIACHCENTY